MSKAILWPRGLAIPILFCLMLAACTPAAPTPKAAETPAGPAKAADAKPAVQTGAQVQASPPAKAAASPGTATAASPVAAAASPAPVATIARVEPKGKFVYGLHVAMSPAWLDPLETQGGTISHFFLMSAVHDALVRPMPGNPHAPSLAESYEVAPDFKSVTFKLRPGVTFHNGDPVTPEDVKFTYENYKGGQAKTFKDKTERIETPDNRTVRFVFKEPFLDFMTLYGSLATGAGWIVPKKYYEQVGPDGFKQKPIGAGPFKFVRQVAGDTIEFEANTAYWRKSPHIKDFVIRSIPENSTRLAALESGEIDVMNLVQSQLMERVKQNPNIQIAPVQSGNYWLEFPGFEKPDSPFRDKRVRQAVSLALQRQALIDFQSSGFGENPGNWMTRDLPGAIDLPKPEENLAKARQLLNEAGYPEGFDGGTMLPFPPNIQLGEILQTQLREVGIRLKLQTMERAAFEQKRSEGPGGLPDGVLLVALSSAPDAAAAIRSAATCKGSSSRTCLPEVEDRFQKFEKSVDPAERTRLLKEIQEYLAENTIFVPAMRNAFVSGQGPRVANKWNEIWGTYFQWLYIGPYEDIQLKD